MNIKKFDGRKSARAEEMERSFENFPVIGQ
jgi:hypothetical protein